MTTGVYQITCTPTGKRYIGSSCDIENRWCHHHSELNHDKHPNIHLQRAWNKHNENSFQFEILEKCKDGQEKIREQKYLDDLRPEFNIYLDARGLSKGHTMSSETRIKMSVAKKGKTPWNKGLKGRKHTPETRAKISVTQKHRCANPEARAKLSKASKDRKLTPEHRARIGAANKGRPSSNKGQSPSEETRKKLSEAAKRQWARQKDKQ